MRNPLFPGRRHQYHWDAGGFLVKEAFRPEVVRAEHITMVGGEQDDGVIVQAFFTERAKNHPQLVIDMRAHGVKSPATDILLFGR